MRKGLFILVIILAIGTAGLFAGPYDEIYTLSLPYQYQSLTVDGSSATNGAHAFDIQLTTSPVNFTMEAGLGADWEYAAYDGTNFLWFDTSGTRVRVGSSGISALATGNASYRNYGFQLEGLDAYISASGFASANLDIGFSPVSSSFITTLSPEVGFGVGRVYGIQNTREIINTLEHFNLPVTVETVKAVAELDYTRGERFNTYTNDYSEILTGYWKEKAELLGIGDKALELYLVGNSQEYAFEKARWSGLRYGWTTYIEARPWFFYSSNSTSDPEFMLDIAIAGEYATLLNNDTLYVRGYADLIPGITTSGTQFFTFKTNLDALARYFFADPRMYAEGTVSIDINSAAAKVFDLDVTAELDYMINPNFTAFAGAQILNTFGTIAVYAGGEMRLF